MPFIAKITVVSGPIRLRDRRRRLGQHRGFERRRSRHPDGPSSAGRSVARIVRRNSARRRYAGSGRARRIAASWAPRATAATSIPAAAPSAASRAARWPPTAPAPKTTHLHQISPPGHVAMHKLRNPVQDLAPPPSLSRGGAAGVLAVLLAHARPRRSTCSRGIAVDVQFATPDGKPMADAEVQGLRAGQSRDKVAVTGRTDKDGKFSFETDRDGLWTAEARNATEIARATGAGRRRRTRASDLAAVALCPARPAYACCWRWRWGSAICARARRLARKNRPDPAVMR